MKILDWFKTKSVSSQDHSVHDSEIKKSKPKSQAPQYVLSSPTQLAKWVAQYALFGIPIEHYYSILPDEDSRKNLNITLNQRERCLREYPVLRIAGISYFIKKHYSDEFWLAFSEAIAPLVKEYVHTENDPEYLQSTPNAIESYVKALTSNRIEDNETTYLRRVYEDNENYLKMKFAGIGTIANEYIFDSYEIFKVFFHKMHTGQSAQ